MADTLEWFAADGTTTNLTCDNKLADGVSGRFAPPSVYSEVLVPDRPGAVLMNVRHDVREIDVPFILQVDCASDAVTGSGAPAVALRTAVRALARTLDPMRGDGYLLSTAPDGVQRKLVCQCVAGPQMAEQRGATQLPRMLAFMLIFRARDPYWYDDIATTVDYTLGDATVFFPFFPLVLSPSSLHSTATVTVDGDVKVWPIWTLTGPFTGVRFALGDSVLRLDYAASAGEVVVIDTRPGAKTVTSDVAGDIFTSLYSAQMFPLESGANALDVQIVGGGTLELLLASQTAISDTSGFIADANVTLARVTGIGPDASVALRLRSLAAGDMNAHPSPGAAVTGGVSYTFTARYLASTSSRTVRLYVDWFDAVGVYLGNSAIAVGVDSASVWTTLSQTAIAPATATLAVIRLQVLNTGAANEDHYVNQLSLRRTGDPAATQIELAYYDRWLSP